MPCRICGQSTRTVLDLGEMPPANGLKEAKEDPDVVHPLVLENCESCKNIQLRDCLDAAQLYRHYLYLTPESPTLSKHYEDLTAHLYREGYVSADSRVLEIGSNVGHFLKYLQPGVKKVMGIDPAENVCRIAEDHGVETLPEFFGLDAVEPVRERLGDPSIIVARHCCAHNENPHSILEGVAALLPDDGYFVMENAYVLDTLKQTDFGQIYHEHMFYFAIQPVMRLFEAHDLKLIDVVMSPIHGGSIVFIASPNRSADQERPSVAHYLGEETKALDRALIEGFAEHVRTIARDLTQQVNGLVDEGASIWAYGATAKAATLLNYVGITDQLVPYCADSTPIKHGKFIPMANVEIRPEQEAFAAKPDYFLITAWNYKDELIAKAKHFAGPECRFIIPVPEVRII